MPVLLAVPAIALCTIMGATLFPRHTYRLQSALKLTDTTSQHYQVVEGSVKDGDTFRVSDGREELEIQLCGIDAPESKQPLGLESRDHLKALIDQGDGGIVLVKAGSARHGHTVAEAFVLTGREDEPEIHLNSEMLMSGMAYLETAFVDTCSNGHLFTAAEERAQKQTVGVWALTNQEKPWKNKANRP